MTIETPGDLTAAILAHAQRQPAGTLILPVDLQHLGSTPIIEQALGDMTASGALYCIERGVFVLPVASRFSGTGQRPPLIDAVLAAYAAQLGEVITTVAAASANLMNVSTHLAVQPVYLTTGRTRRIALGGHDVELRHGPRWQTALGNSRAGHVVRAMVWMGADGAEGMADHLMRELSLEERQQVVVTTEAAPAWIHQALRSAVAVA